MKIVFITIATPYKENMGGPSGHPYHLLAGRPEGIDATIYSFNINHLTPTQIDEAKQELGVDIHLLEMPRWMRWLLKWRLSFIRLFLKYPIYYYNRLSSAQIAEIRDQNPDRLWFYGQELCGIVKQFPDIKTVFTIADCYTFHFYRRLALPQTVETSGEYWRVVMNYKKFYRMEAGYPSVNVIYHTVGQADKRFLESINPHLDIHFLRHPHYILAKPAKTIGFGNDKIKLLIAGRYDLYSWEAADALIDELVKATKEIKDNYSLTILGKGWEEKFGRLKSAGWDVELIKFAPDYIEEIIKHDIQINPLSLGTGTKGKVLDAFANGLMVIGTGYAMENIAVHSGESCVEYERADEVIAVLRDVLANREKYEAMAEAGRRAVLVEHGRERVAQDFFSLFHL